MRLTERFAAMCGRRSYYGVLGASLLPSRDLVAMLARGMQPASADLAKLQAAAAQSSQLAGSGIGSGGGSAAVLLVHGR